MKVLVAVDMQNDFIDGALGTLESHRNALEAMKMCQIRVDNE
jgi:nicotinamidase-related amidase